MPNQSSSRRKFLSQVSKTGILLAAPIASLADDEKYETRILQHERKISSNDKIRLGCIGMGIMGYNDVNSAIKVPGVEMVAACDLYSL